MTERVKSTGLCEPDGILYDMSWPELEAHLRDAHGLRLVKAADVTVTWRGSSSDLATDLAALMGRDQLLELACELLLRARR